MNVTAAGQQQEVYS